MAMDRAYCSEINKELQSIRSKREEQQKRQLEKSRSKRG